MQAVMWSADLKQAVSKKKKLELQQAVNRFNDQKNTEALSLTADEQRLVDTMFQSTNKKVKDPALGSWA